MGRLAKPWMWVPLGASAVGAVVAARAGVPCRAFAPSLFAAGLGGAAASIARPERFAPFRLAAGIVAIGLIAATLATDGAEGVRRWLPLGPMSLHASAALAPFVITAAAARAACGKAFMSLAFAFALAAVHSVQPDGAQALAAFAAFASAAVMAREVPPWWRVAVVLVSAVALRFAWRTDALPIVPHVEGIVRLARNEGAGPLAAVALAIGALLWALTIAARRHLQYARDSVEALAAASLAAYLFAQVAASALGPYPVPVVGAGAGPVLGACACLWLVR